VTNDFMWRVHTTARSMSGKYYRKMIMVCDFVTVWSPMWAGLLGVRSVVCKWVCTLSGMAH